MRYKMLEFLVSPARVGRYLAATKGDKRRAGRAYRTNMRLAKSFMELAGMFEVILRNRIDAHYRQHFAGASHEGWLWDAVQPGGVFDNPGCRNTRVAILESARQQGQKRTHDKLVASLSFGFWKYLFANNQFMAGGNTLLRAFPNRPHKTNQSMIYAKLDKINAIRNRAAHHEPVCFDQAGGFSDQYVRDHQSEIHDLVNWMGLPAIHIFRGIDNTKVHCRELSRI